MSATPDPRWTAPTPLDAALRGLCPRCGARTLFATFLDFAPRCRACGLDYAAFNVGDGAAAFLILIVGALVSVLAIWLELTISPAWWVHVLLWLPLSIGLTVMSLRFAKGLLIDLEYRNAAREGHIKEPE